MPILNGPLRAACLSLASAAVFASAPTAAQSTTDARTLPVQVVNPNSSPVPVTGTVSAAVTGPVDVRSVPTTVTDRLDLMLERLDDLADAVARSRPTAASYVRTFSHVGDNTQWDFGQLVLVSQLIITAENDEMELWFCRDRLANCASLPASDFLRFGSLNQQFPGQLVIPFAQPVQLGGLYFFCHNSVENCEPKVAVIGTAVPGT